MKNIEKVFVKPEILKYAKKRNILSALKKSIEKIKTGNAYSLQLKLRKPKSDQIWQFRINKKYRVLGIIDEEDFIIYKISDHQ